MALEKTFCRFAVFSLKEEIAISFAVNTLPVHSFIQRANKCLFSVSLRPVRWATHLMISTSTPAVFQGLSPARTAPTWLLSGSLSLAPSFSSRPLFLFVSGRKLESSSCYLGSSHTLWVFYSTHSLIHPRSTECSSSKQ